MRPNISVTDWNNIFCRLLLVTGYELEFETQARAKFYYCSEFGTMYYWKNNNHQMLMWIIEIS